MIRKKAAKLYTLFEIGIEEKELLIKEQVKRCCMEVAEDGTC